jgi:error-prone DNA polymerase
MIDAPSDVYVELHCHSYFSLLDGASPPEALVERAVALGYPALALTDHDGLYGAVRFWQAAHERGLKPILGAEVSLPEAGPDPGEAGQVHLTLLAADQQGYANLCRLISAGQMAGQKGRPRLTLDMLAAHSQGLICLSGCRQGAVAAALLARDPERARRAAGELRDLFGDRLWIEVQCHYLPADARLVPALVELAGWLEAGSGRGGGLVATNDVHYATRAGQRLHDVLSCVRRRVTLPEALAAGLLHPNSERCLKSAREMQALFDELPQAVRNTWNIAERCQFVPNWQAQRLPAFSVPEGHTPTGYLRALCEAALPRKFDLISPRVRAQMDHELGVIERVGLAGYFLIVWDIVHFARRQGIRCQGRGSAANSLVAYLLDITPVDPLQHNLLFERFLSEEATTTPLHSVSGTLPDIDVDLDADRREEVIQYVYQRYGEERVGMVCNVVTYRARSAVRDVAKVLAFPPDVIDQAAKALDTRSAAVAAGELDVSLHGTRERLDKSRTPESPESRACSDERLDEGSSPWHILAELLAEIDGVPRHLSIHVGGMLITAAPLVEVVPLERATMPGRVVVQWDKDSVEDAGLIKIDLLSLRTLAAIDEALAHVKAQHGLAIDPERLPLDDPAVYDLLQRADTVGCFQVESRAQAQMLPRLRPACFEDMVIEVALIRPGPIQGNMVHPYLRRRQGLEPVSYAHPSLEPALAETLGVMVFQEQVMRAAMAVAGFTPGEADRLRRALSRSRPAAALAPLRERFMAGARANGLDEATAAGIFEQLAAFTGYGFCKSHAAAFALLAYQSLYLKAHYPAEFYCALLNHQPMGFYPPEVLAGDARRHGVQVLAPDITLSEQACTLEGGAIRLGLRYVHGLADAYTERIVARRGAQPFSGLADFCRRTRLPRPAVETLIRAGALDGLGRARPETRRVLLWDLGGLVYLEDGLDLEAPIEPADLPVLTQAERLGWEYELLGLSPGAQVMELYREKLRAQGVLSSGELQDSGPRAWGRPLFSSDGKEKGRGEGEGRPVRVAGWAVIRQRPPTAKGFTFLTLEDEEGLINLIVQPAVYERYRSALRNAPLIVAEGQLQREGQVCSVLVTRAWAI